MATLINKPLEEKDQSNAQSAPTALSGPSAPSLAAPATPQQKASSGRFTNVQSYLNANKGAGQKIANVVGSTVQKDITSAGKQVTDEASKISSNIGAEKERLAKASGFQSQLGTLGEGAQAIASDTQKLSDFQKLYTNQNMSQQQQQALNEQAAAAQSTLQKAQQGAQALGTESGRMSALQRVLQRPSYTQGQRTLDQLMFQVGGAKQVAAQQGQFGQQIAGMQKTQEQQVQDLAKQLEANKTSEIEAEKLLRGALTGATGGFEQAQTQESIAKSAENARLNSLYQQYIMGNTEGIADTDLQTIKQSLGDKSGIKTYGVTQGDAYQKYLQQGRTNLTTQDVVDAQDLARFQALATLGSGQSKYTQAGDMGPASGIKADMLASDAAKARDELLKGLGGIGSLTAGTRPGDYYGSGSVSQVTVGGDQFLRNALEAIENKQASDFGTVSSVGNINLPSDFGGIRARSEANQRAGTILTPGSQGYGEGVNNTRHLAGQGLSIDESGNLVARTPVEDYDAQRHINYATRDAAQTIQNYLDRWLNENKYFDTLGSRNDSTGSIFGQNRQIGTTTVDTSKFAPATGKGK